jgi:hypothetical protein
MSADFEQPVAASDHGKHRREQWMASLRANSEMMSQAAMEAHQEDHYAVNAGQVGLFGHMSPEDKGAAVAARAATVGADYGGRPLERHGGLYDHHNEAPVPARVDLRHINTPGRQPTTVSPLWAYMQGRQ